MARRYVKTTHEAYKNTSVFSWKTQQLYSLEHFALCLPVVLSSKICSTAIQ